MNKRSHEHVAVFTEIVDRAKNGDDKAVLFLRKFLMDTSQTMPDALVIEVAELLRDSRRDELRGEEELN